MKWEPIATAPQLEPILLFDEDWESTIGAIQIGHIKADGSAEIAETDDFSPTHWMPLPEPPCTDEELDD
jgi:Protein of unknown function (DUF551)